MNSLTSSRTVMFFDDTFGTDDMDWNPPKEGQYYAAVVSNGEEKPLGWFDTPEQAYEAYKAAK